MTDVVKAAEDIAISGLPEVQGFFDDPNGEQEKKAKLALKALSHYASMRSARAREASTMLGMAKLFGLSGEQAVNVLDPIFSGLSGRSAQGLLPDGSERSSSDAAQSTTDQ